MSKPRAALLILFALGLLQLALRYPALPETVASHFGPNGHADGFMRKSVWLWVSVGMLAFPALLSLLIPPMVARMPPSAVNLPNKDYWLAPERKAEGLDRLASAFAWFGVGMLALMVWTLHLVYDANARGGALSNAGMLGGLGLFAVFLVSWLVSLQRAFAVPR